MSNLVMSKYCLWIKVSRASYVLKTEWKTSGINHVCVLFVPLCVFRDLAKLNQRGIDKDYSPTGHSGCAAESGLAPAAGTETYTLRHSGKRWHTQTRTNIRIERQTYCTSCQQWERQSPNIRSKCLTPLNPSLTLLMELALLPPFTLDPAQMECHHFSHSRSLVIVASVCRRKSREKGKLMI